MEVRPVDDWIGDCDARIVIVLFANLHGTIVVRRFPPKELVRSKKMSRPEHSGPPELFYNEEESAKYSSNSHIISVQSEMSARALELLALPDDGPRLLLDIGCGSGLSGEVLSEAGHHWIGVDISEAMLRVAQKYREVTDDLILKDMGTGLPFRPGTFDGAISISAIQWLCHANTSNENPRNRLLHFFQSLYACLGRGTRAVFQFYPENADQSELISAQATRAGFSGGLVVDYPNSAKAKKIYLVLMTGGMQVLPKALAAENEQSSQVSSIARRTFSKGRSENRKLVKGSKAWIEAKKERARKQGREVHETSKYSGRRRKKIF